MMSKLVRYIINIVLILAILAAIVYFTVPILNDTRCKQSQDDYYNSFVMPDKAEYVASGYECGKFWADSNGVTYLNTIVIKSSYHIDEVKTFYERKNIDVRVESARAIDFIYADYPTSIVYQELKNLNSLDGYYIIYRNVDTGSSFLTKFDKRGHEKSNQRNEVNAN